MDRRLIVVAGLACSFGAVAQADRQASLPLRNLLIEVRQTQDDAAAAPADGSVVIRSDGTMQGMTRGSITTRSRDVARETAQQVTVLNGGRGSIRLSQLVPYQFMQVTVSSERGIEATPGTVWRDTGTGFIVHPRWPGGRQPATVELSAEASDARLLTTVQMPLGEWLTIARSAALGDSGQRFALQMRVSVP